MARKERGLTGLLRTPIDLAKIPQRWLHASFGLPPNADDGRKYIGNELAKRWMEFDKTFGLDSGSPDIWKQRAHELAFEYVPGFSIKNSARLEPGRPRQWSDLMLVQLFADVEYERGKTGRNLHRICEENLKGWIYRQRWEHFTPTVLRKRYGQADKKRADDQFALDLSGAKAFAIGDRKGLIEAAIRRHALKTPL